MAVQIQLRRDTAANWTSSNPILVQGEPGVETNTGKLKLGDGVTAWNSLAYSAAGNASTVTTNANLTGDVTSTGNATAIAAGVIVNADVNATAAIAGSKIVAATTSVVGAVQLTDSTSSTSITTAATPNSVKSSFDAATVALGVANAALPKAGGTMTGALVVPLASAATPSLTFTGDLNTGIFSPGADQLAISTNGVQRINIEADGDINIDGGGVFYDATNNRLAIGTTSPGALLHLSQAGSAAVGPEIRLHNSSNSAGDKARISFFNGGSPGSIRGALDFNTQSGGNGELIWSSGESTVTEKFRCDGSGRLLVGTSTARSNIFRQGTTGITPFTQIESAINSYNNGLSIINNSATGFGAMLNLATSYSTSLNSNVIGSANQQAGTINFLSNDGTNFVDCAQIRADVDGTPGANDMPGRLVFSTTKDDEASPTERMRIDSAGGLYIGPAGDYANSNYSQTTGNGNFYYRRDNGSEAGSIIASNNANHSWALAYLNKFAWDSGDDSRWIVFYLNGVNQDSISWTGSAISYGTSSDYRRKTNPSTYAGGLEKVKQLHVREYEWVEFPEAGKTVGFFAHELQEIFPQAVTGVKDGMKIDEFSGEEVPSYQGIDYGKITPLLAAALQEAIAKIESLEARLSAAGL